LTNRRQSDSIDGTSIVGRAVEQRRHTVAATSPAFRIVPIPWGVQVIQELGGGWWAVYHMGLDRPRITSATVSTVVPGPASDPNPSTSGELTTRMLRAMAPAAAIAYATQKWRELTGDLSPTMPRYEQLKDVFGPGWFEAIERQEPGATGRSQLRRRRLAATAALYVQALQAGDRTPVATLATNLGLPQSKVRDRLHAARFEGLLAETGRGRAGGGLTPEAQALLELEVGWRGETQTPR
jgi:hypothetical protein